MTQQSPCHSGVQVLVVEDEALVRMGTVAALEDLGCTTLDAPTADEAIAILRANPEIQVLFTDIQTPGKLTGLDLAHYVNKEWPQIRIIICSGRILSPKFALPDGARFIAKPYYQTDLEDIARGGVCKNS